MKKVCHLLILLTVLLAVACEDDSYSYNPKHTLSFARDTLCLDTIFTGIGTSTSILKVYNRNSKPLLISSVYLADAGKSGFRINVDGLKGSSFNDVEIRGKDSLHIFVEATIDERNQDLPFLVKDSIVFITNGVQQDVKLLAHGQDALRLRGEIIEADATFTAARPILVYDSLHVAADATLTLEPGVRLHFHAGAGLSVYGRLKAEGNIALPIVFRGDRTDNLFTDVPYDRLPGQWGGITLHTESYENVFDYVDVRGGSYGIRCDSAAADRSKLTLLNSRITQTAGHALSMTNCRAEVLNTEISNAKGYCVLLLGGDYEFTHCTLANYYSWDLRQGTTLFMGNHKQVNGGETIAYPLTGASFSNCIIAGSSTNELSTAISDDESVPYNDYFSHCVINAKEKEGDNLVNNVWVKDDHFALLERATQLYDFRLEESSLAIDAGLMNDAAWCLVDRNGISRISDQAPDAGCYEWTGE